MKRIELALGARALSLELSIDTSSIIWFTGAPNTLSRSTAATFDRSRAERHRFAVDDDWQRRWAKRQARARLLQLGSLRGGNHFIELQRCEETPRSCSGSHRLARLGGHALQQTTLTSRARRTRGYTDLDLVTLSRSRTLSNYLNAVAAGGNFAIITAYHLEQGPKRSNGVRGERNDL